MNLNKIKKNLPNMLTLSRIILTPIIMATFLTGNFIPTIILTIYSMITDFFDGYLSRKWNTTSKLGALLDQIADKAFAIGALLVSLEFVPLLSINLILEGIIAGINIISKFKGNKTKTLFSGKVKTWSLFITLASSIATKFIPHLRFLSNALSVITTLLQSKTFYDYYQNYTIQENDKKNNINKVEDIESIIQNNPNNYDNSINKNHDITDSITFLKQLKNELLGSNKNDNKKNKTKIK